MDEPPIADTLDKLLWRLGFDPTDRDELARVRKDIGFLRKLREKAEYQERQAADMYQSGRKNLLQQTLAGVGWALAALVVGIAGALGWKGHS